VALVDHELLVLRLKERLVGKGSWGQRELLALLVELEVSCHLPEAPVDRLFRLYRAELEEAFFNRRPSDTDTTESLPADPVAACDGVMGALRP
jgi:hypothetical protein